MFEQALIEKLQQNNLRRVHTFPAREDCEQFIDALFALLFMDDLESVTHRKKLHLDLKQLQEAFRHILSSVLHNKEEIDAHNQSFCSALPAVYDALLKDADAILAADPAAHNLQEVIIAYPGFFATAVYRFSHQLYSQGFHTLSRFFAEYAHSKTGIDIHPGAKIGYSFAIDHGTGVVIGETSVIGDNVKIYQGVTLGALNVSKDKASIKRHPTIQDNVVMYAGATVLGGDTVIGSGSIIGGNVWLTYSVPANSVVYHKSEVHVKDNNPFPEPLNFEI